MANARPVFENLHRLLQPVLPHPIPKRHHPSDLTHKLTHKTEHTQDNLNSATIARLFVANYNNAPPHANGFNLLFCDGHAKWMRYEATHNQGGPACETPLATRSVFDRRHPF